MPRVKREWLEEALTLLEVFERLLATGVLDKGLTFEGVHGRVQRVLGNDTPSYPTSPPDGHLLHAAFTRPLFDGKMPSFVDELKARGYDIETIRFSIAKKPKTPAPPPPGEAVGEEGT